MIIDIFFTKWDDPASTLPREEMARDSWFDKGRTTKSSGNVGDLR